MSLVVSILVAYLVCVGRRDKLSLVGSGMAVAMGLSVAFDAALAYPPRPCSMIAVALVAAMIFG